MLIVIVIMTIVALCTVALFANARWVDSQTRSASPRDGGQLIDGRVAWANVKVEGTGLTIVLIHGFGAAINWWDSIAPELAANHRVIRIDLLGHGGTAAPATGYSIKEQAALVLAVLDSLAVGRFSVAGHSMGGEVAIAIAEINSQRIDRMILIDSPPTVGTTFTFTTKAYLTPVLGELLSHFRSDRQIRRGLAQGFAPGFPVPEKFVNDLKQLTYTAFRMAHNESIAYRQSKPPYKRIAALNSVPPLLVICGSRDAIIPPAHTELFEQVPGAKVTMIEDVGHSPLVESPREVLELIERFSRRAT
jgi:pimeloyl-ACP methyl ester carboxylesterase